MAEESDPPTGRDSAGPTERVELRHSGFGVQVNDDPGRLRTFFETITSVSASPYPSAEMLAGYVERGLPDLVAKTISTIDEQIAHRQRLERQREEGSRTRRNLAQLGALILGVFGTLGALMAGYYGVPSSICIAVVVMSVGGPNAATVVARLLDRVERSR